MTSFTALLFYRGAVFLFASYLYKACHFPIFAYSSSTDLLELETERTEKDGTWC
jgi:hypothetical protein